MKRLVLIFTVFTTLAFLNGCGPRGETKSLDQLLAGAKQRYSAVTPSGLDNNTSAALAKLVDGLKQLEGGQPSSSFAAQSAEILGQLEGKAGYTARPAMRELIGQYKALSAESGAAATRLLVARTYNLLATELETTHFSVN